MICNPGIGQDLLCQLSHIGAFKTHDQRHRHLYLFGGFHQALGNDIAAHDAAEDIDQDGLDMRVVQHQLEGLGDLVGLRTGPPTSRKLAGSPP